MTRLVDKLATELAAAGATVTHSADGTPIIHMPMDGLGHNSGKPARNGNADDRLRLLIERIERMEEEKKGINDDIKDVYREAKAVGYDAKMMKQALRLRKMDPDKRREEEAILDLYKAALGID